MLKQHKASKFFFFLILLLGCNSKNIEKMPALSPAFNIGGGSSAWNICPAPDNGDGLWSRTYGDKGSHAYIPYQTTSMTDGSYTMVGAYSCGDITNPQGASCPDIADDDKRHAFVARLNANGAISWQKILDTKFFNYAKAVVGNKDGSVTVAGVTGSDQIEQKNETFRDLWAARLDASGNIVWKFRYKLNSFSAKSSALVATKQGYLLAGIIRRSGTFMNGIWAVGINFDGKILWQRLYMAPGPKVDIQDFSISRAETKHDNQQDLFQDTFVFAGSFKDAEGLAGTYSYDSFAFRITESGGLVWSYAYDTALDQGNVVHLQENIVHDIVTVSGTDSSKGYWLAGHNSKLEMIGGIEPPAGTKTNYYTNLFKIDENGGIESATSYAFVSPDRFSLGEKITVAQDGSIYLAGNTAGSLYGPLNPFDFYDTWVVKIDAKTMSPMAARTYSSFISDFIGGTVWAGEGGDMPGNLIPNPNGSGILMTMTTMMNSPVYDLANNTANISLEPWLTTINQDLSAPVHSCPTEVQPGGYITGGLSLGTSITVSSNPMEIERTILSLEVTNPITFGVAYDLDLEVVDSKMEVQTVYGAQP